MLQNTNLFTEMSLEELSQISGGHSVSISDKGLFIDGEQIKPNTVSSDNYEIDNLKVKIYSAEYVSD